MKRHGRLPLVALLFAAWSVAVGASGVACNAVFGLDGLGPVASGAADAADAVAADGGVGGDSASDGAEPATCPAPLPDGGSAIACPVLEAGACGPESIAFVTPTFVPPTRPNDQCSADQLASVYADCLGADATAAGCSDWMAANPMCSACIFADLGAKTYGPYFVYPGDFATFNNAGCVVLLDPCQEPCARIFQSYVDCEYNSCAANPSCATSFSAQAACEPEAATCACLPQSQAEAACETSIMESPSPAAACLTTSVADIQKLLPLFCGHPDAG